MKKTWISGLLSCGLFTATQAQTGIIGINTSKPQGVLHIGGASTPATANLPSGLYCYVNQFAVPGRYATMERLTYAQDYCKYLILKILCLCKRRTSIVIQKERRIVLSFF